MKLQAFLIATALLAAATASAGAQSRYTPPRSAPLSADLASPWIVQLRNKPGAGGGYTVEIARPQAATQQRPVPRPQRHDGFHKITPIFSMPGLPVFTPQAAPSQAYIAPASPGYAQPPLPGQRMAPAPRMEMRPAARDVQQASVQVRPATPQQEFDPQYEIHTVAYDGGQAPGTIVIDTSQRFLFLVQEDGTARRYGIGVGKEGFEWSGTEKISRKAEWPGWTPPKEMIAREAARGHYIPDHMEGGPKNPLGARALYLGDTLYRIHGTNQPWTIGRAVSSGCIRMRNEDVMDLYERVGVGTKVIVG